LQYLWSFFVRFATGKRKGKGKLYFYIWENLNKIIYSDKEHTGWNPCLSLKFHTLRRFLQLRSAMCEVRFSSHRSVKWLWRHKGIEKLMSLDKYCLLTKEWTLYMLYMSKMSSELPYYNQPQHGELWSLIYILPEPQLANNKEAVYISTY